MLVKAQKYLKQYSYREVANWLSRNTGQIISHVGLKKRLDNERRRKNKVGSLRRWADYAKKAIAKAEEIENKRLGAKAYEEEDSKPVSIVEEILLRNNTTLFSNQMKDHRQTF